MICMITSIDPILGCRPPAPRPLVSQFVFISAVPVLVGPGKAVIETFILWKLSFMNQLLLYCYHFVIISFGGIFIHFISEIVSAEL